MKNNDLYKLFLEELKTTYSAEQQIIDALPTLINAVSLPELKEALNNELKESKTEIKRVEKIFSTLGETATKEPNKALQAILNQAEKFVKDKASSPILDAAILSLAQKIEHFELASYESLLSFAKNLDLDHEIIALLQDTVNEETVTDKKFIKLAETTSFKTELNKVATARR